MRWQDNWKACTRAFDDWRLVERDIRAYLEFGLNVMSEAYDKIWDEIANEPSNGEGPELPDVFDDRIAGVWPHEFQWMFLSGGLRDAVTAYEVYLEKALEEVLRHNGRSIAGYTKERSLTWKQLIELYEGALGISLDDDEVTHVRTIRHILVHKRGELRTEEQRSQYGSTGSFGLGREVDLELGGVLDHMDVLSSSVNRIDPVAWKASWGRSPPAELAAFLEATESSETGGAHS
jgi:hypothetical protein